MEANKRHQAKRDAQGVRQKAVDEVEKDVLVDAAAYRLNDDLLKQQEREKAKELAIYGVKGKFIKRRGQVDDQTVNNMGYRKSLAHKKYVMFGSKGYYAEKDVAFWHANIDQTALDKGYRQIKIKKQNDVEEMVGKQQGADKPFI